MKNGAGACGEKYLVGIRPGLKSILSIRFFHVCCHSHSNSPLPPSHLSLSPLSLTSISYYLPLPSGCLPLSRRVHFSLSLSLTHSSLLYPSKHLPFNHYFPLFLTSVSILQHPTLFLPLSLFPSLSLSLSLSATSPSHALGHVLQRRLC